METIITLEAGPARLRLAPSLGGRVTRLRLAAPGASEARDILLSFPEETEPGALLHWPKGGLYPLVPYGNRIRDARLVFGGRTYDLPAHPDAAPHTLHGHTHRVAWEVVEATPRSATWRLAHPGGGEWPWRFEVTIAAALSPSSVRFDLALRNDGPNPMPAGLGLHPYFRHASDDRVGFRATVEWPKTPDDLAGPPRSVPPDHDPPRALPPGGLTRYVSGWDHLCRLQAADGSVVSLSASPIFDHLVVHRPEAGAYLCLEPTTHAPDGFNAEARGIAGAGALTLAPGETLAGSVTVAADR